jgi:hypothetical protein
VDWFTKLENGGRLGLKLECREEGWVLGLQSYNIKVCSGFTKVEH